MKDSGEVGVPEFIRLMKDFLENRIVAKQYAEEYFTLMVKRMTLTDKESRILQQAYGDADDYEPDPMIELSNLIKEPQLKERVAKSLRELAELGYCLESEAPSQAD